MLMATISWENIWSAEPISTNRVHETGKKRRRKRSQKTWVTTENCESKFHVKGGAEPDIIVRTGFGDFGVHREVLCSCSPIFKAMLTKPFLVSYLAFIKHTLMLTKYPGVQKQHHI